MSSKEKIDYGKLLEFYKMDLEMSLGDFRKGKLFVDSSLFAIVYNLLNKNKPFECYGPRCQGLEGRVVTINYRGEIFPCNRLMSKKYLLATRFSKEKVLQRLNGLNIQLKNSIARNCKKCKFINFCPNGCFAMHDSSGIQYCDFYKQLIPFILQELVLDYENISDWAKKSIEKLYPQQLKNG